MSEIRLSERNGQLQISILDIYKESVLIRKFKTLLFLEA